MTLKKISSFFLSVLASSVLISVFAINNTSDHASPNPLHAQLFVQTFGQVELSPDGKLIAWVETLIDKNGGPTNSQAIYFTDSKNPNKTTQIRATAKKGPSMNNGIAWSPDNKRLAFLSDAEQAGQQQLYLYNINTQSARIITHVKGFLSTPKWSPDGKSISVLFTENISQQNGAQDAQAAHSGVIKDSYYEQRLAVVDLHSGNLTLLTPDDFFVYEYDWSPDGKQLVFTGAKGNGNNNWFIAQLCAVDISSKKMKTLFKPSFQIGRPAVSPDGKNVAFLMGLNSDAVVVGGDIYVVPINGGPALNITNNRKATATFVTWVNHSKILGVENKDGESSIVLIDFPNGNIYSVYHDFVHFSSGSFTPSIALSHDRTLSAFYRSSFMNPPEIFAGEFGKWQQITHRNISIKPNWGEVKNLHWKNKDMNLQGWLVYPKDFNPSKKYPMIVDVHGGPSYGIQSSWPTIHNYSMSLPSKGYFVFFPNPRGSFGQGQAFTQANRKDFGYGDWQDIMAGVDEALRIAPVDPQRLGLTGWSYGGYMTMWGVTQSQRFKAAMAGAGVANWISYYGQNAIDQWLIPFFGQSMYDAPELYARSSPITFIKNVKTPTLIIAAEGDGECPVPQSYEFWHALKTFGVPTEFVVYNKEGHAFSNPENLRDLITRTHVWFDHYLQQKEG